MSPRALIFDYGGTIDTASTHWSEVLWAAYQACGVPVSKEQFRDAYVHGERTLARQPLIRPEHTMLDLLRIKVDIECSVFGDLVAPSVREAIACHCYEHVLSVLAVSRPVLAELAAHYPMALVSNFYGNIQAILTDFALRPYFSHIIESAVVGVRKPDPRIFQLGVVALGLPAADVAVVGDSFSKDILPARAAGCQTIWYRGIGWGDEQTDETIPTAIIENFRELPSLLL